MKHNKCKTHSKTKRISPDFFYFSLVLLSLTIIFSYTPGCGSPFTKNEKINASFNLINQDSSRVTFPDDFTDKVIVMGFIYTNCPDICPLTVLNMKLIQEKMKKEQKGEVEFVALSFDPERDKPYILKQYAGIREINLYNFNFLTGKKTEIDSLLNIMHVYAFPDDTTKGPGGEEFYYMTHTDRITLIDKDGKIREDYSGSQADLDKLLDDIKSLL